MAESDPRPFKTASPDEPRAPDGVTIYAIGDLHGRADLLERLMEQIRADRAAIADRAELIFIGDYIDRGPSSDAVIDQILDLQHDPDFSVTTLKGNHESLALQFLADPAVGHFWCHIGGRQTLLSYGVTPPIGPSDMEQWEATRQAFEAALPATHLAFLQQLSIYAVRGSYVFVHAGLRPGVKLARQREWDMLWIRNEFLEHRGRFEKVVVHGHTSGDQPFLGPNRIGIDTGAEISCRLTGLKLVGAEQRLMSATIPARPSRPADGSFYPATRPPTARPSPPPPAALGAPTGAVASVPWRRALSAEAWTYATLPAGLAVLAAIGYLASQTGTPAQSPPPDERLAAPSSNPDIDDLTVRADEALNAAASRARTRSANAAKSTTIVPQAGRTTPVVAAAPPVSPPSAKASSVPTITPAATAADGRSAAAAPAAPAVAKPDRTAVATSTAKDMPASRPGGKQAEPRRAAPSAGPQASPAGNRVADAVSGSKPPPAQQERRRRTETAAATPDVVPATSGEAARGPDPGVSAGQLAAYTRSVPIMNSNRIGPLDYPNASIRADEEGVVGVRYVVTTDGRVSACTTIEPSSFARLNRRTCELIRTRFRFKPALRNGQPVEEEREQRIRWQLSG